MIDNHMVLPAEDDEAYYRHQSMALRSYDYDRHDYRTPEEILEDAERAETIIPQTEANKVWQARLDARIAADRKLFAR